MPIETTATKTPIATACHLGQCVFLRVKKIPSSLEHRLDEKDVTLRLWFEGSRFSFAMNVLMVRS